MRTGWLAGAALCACLAGRAGAPQPDVEEIVKRSVANTRADWQAAPQFNFMERDVVAKSGRRQIRTYRVSMMDGSPYYNLTAVNGQPLAPAQAAKEEQKMQREAAVRRGESERARARRIAEYQRERRQDFELMQQMAQAFNYRLAGEETVAGHRCYVLEASPRPDYQPIDRDTRVLKGMRGKMWVDEQEYQWVKVRAEVFRPVAFGLFLAHVQPGTEFALEQQPTRGKVWLPSHFEMRVQASVLFWAHNSTDDETYWDYTPAPWSKLSTRHAGIRAGIATTRK